MTANERVPSGVPDHCSAGERFSPVHPKPPNTDRSGMAAPSAKASLVTRSVAGAEGALAPGAHAGRTDYGAGAYGGPCPPPGPAHRYRFSVYALDAAPLGAPEGSSAALVRFMLRGHVLAYGTLTGTYGR